jgi:hypothetical protein
MHAVQPICGELYHSMVPADRFEVHRDMCTWQRYSLCIYCRRNILCVFVLPGARHLLDCVVLVIQNQSKQITLWCAVPAQHNGDVQLVV